MALKDTVKHLRDLLANITHDLEKADNGNKAASQRVRTGTVRLEKVAKLYRKESIKSEKATKGQKKPSKKASTAKKPAKSGKAVAKATVKAKKPAAKHVAKTSARARAFSVKRPTAKVPAKRR
jgi:hypothetical protein